MPMLGVKTDHFGYSSSGSHCLAEYILSREVLSPLFFFAELQ